MARPDEGSGFEADPYSPAGTAQREWWFIQASQRIPWLRFVLRGTIAVVLALTAAVAFVHALS